MNIAFIGLGRMGGHMARNILDSGQHNLRIFDLSRDTMHALLKDGAKAATSPQDAATGADIVFTSLPGPQDVLEVALGEGGILAGMSEGAIYIDLSTVSPQTLQRVAEVAAPQRIAVLDSPVSGGTIGAEKGTLCLMAGGDRAAFDTAKPVMDLIGDPDKVLHCGAVGSGSVCKLVNNLIGMTTSVVLSEAFSMGMAAGVDARTLYNVVSGSTGHSVTLAQWDDTILSGNYEPGFALSLAAKDIRLATELGRAMKIPMEISNIADQKYVEAMNDGLGDEAVQSIAKVIEKRTGTPIRYPSTD